MDTLEELINRISQHIKEVRRAEKLLNNIKLSMDRGLDLSKLRRELSNIEDLNCDELLIQQIREWIREMHSFLEKEEVRIRKEFANELEKRLEDIGVKLSGNYPKLKAGLFTIVVNFEKLNAIVWYGPEQEKLFQCSLSVEEIVTRLKEKKANLGSKLDEDEIYKKLITAYQRALYSMKSYYETFDDNAVPITKVLIEMSFLLQEPRFYQDPRRDYYRSYSRADFSFDLFRMKSYGKEFILKIATREATKTRSGFLWVPSNEDGEGSTYSHLEIPQ